MALNLPKFDPLRPMVAMANFLYSGDRYMRGDPFPQPGIDVPDRKLKQLYELRRITYADSGEAPERDLPKEPPTDRGVAPEGKQPGEVIAEVEDLEAQADKLQKAHTKDELLKKASGLAGVTKDLTKVQIARELIKAGRGGAA